MDPTALDRIRETLKAAKTDAERKAALVEEAEFLAELGDFDAARERAEESGSVPTRAKVEIAARKLDRARELLEGATGNLRAELDLLRGDGEAAMLALDHADANDPHAAVLKARATALRGYAQQALEMLTTIQSRVTAAAPELRWKLTAARASALREQGRMKEAAAEFKSAAEQIQAIAVKLPPAMAALYLDAPERREVLNFEAYQSSVDDAELTRLRRMMQAVRRINSESEIGPTVESTLDAMIELAGASRGLLIMKDAGGRRIEAARHRDRRPLGEDELRISRSIVEEVLEAGTAVLTENAQASPRYQKFESVQKGGMKSVLCVPLRQGRRTLGAVYLDSKDVAGVFSRAHQEVVQLLADQAAIALARAEESGEKNRRIGALESRVKLLESRTSYGDMLGRSSAIQRVFALLDKLAETEYPVVIEGETGTGKELAAHAIHERGKRKDRPFIPVDCGALTETLLESELFGHVKGAFTGADRDRDGLFKAAHEGTIFLDEIEAMSPGLQQKLLRVLENREVRPVGAKQPFEVNVRVIAATNQPLKGLVDRQAFRADLYYRLQTFVVQMPPLRERVEDIPLMVERILADVAKELGQPVKHVTRDALAILQKAPWPGNVRELKNELRRLVVTCGEEIGALDLPPYLRDHDKITTALITPGTFDEKLNAFERGLIIRALEQNDWLIRPTARSLGMDRNTLKGRIKKFGIEVKGD